MFLVCHLKKTILTPVQHKHVQELTLTCPDPFQSLSFLVGLCQQSVHSIYKFWLVGGVCSCLLYLIVCSRAVFLPTHFNRGLFCCFALLHHTRSAFLSQTQMLQILFTSTCATPCTAWNTPVVPPHGGSLSAGPLISYHWGLSEGN
jgi:hypothetical protein